VTGIPASDWTDNLMDKHYKLEVEMEIISYWSKPVYEVLPADPLFSNLGYVQAPHAPFSVH
jgi:hypothetical protein